jgi:polar amino acid transport system permease protein
MNFLAFGGMGWGGQLAAGTLLTIELALATLPFGLALGLGLAFLKDSSHWFPRAASEAYTTVFRGLPELMTLLLLYYGSEIALHALAASLGYDINVEISPFLAGVIALGLVLGAYSSEVLYGALKAIDRGQIEAGQSLGMRPLPVFLTIQFPQLLRIALPGLGNCWLVLLKDTSLVSVIALEELTRKTYLAAGQTKEYFLFFSVAGGIYLLLTMLSGVGLVGLERHLNRGWRSGR